MILSADYFADPGTLTFVGYLMLFQHIGLGHTISSYASDGGILISLPPKLTWKIYHEAKFLRGYTAWRCGSTTS